MLYYDAIRNPSTFAKMALAEQAENFETLYQANDWQSAVSHWDRKHLFASRLICSEPSRHLSLFTEQDFFQDGIDNLHPCIKRLIAGPGGNAHLAGLWEPQCVQQYQPDSLGYTWAALASFLRAAPETWPIPSTKRPGREKKAAPQGQGFVPSTDIQIGSSSPTRPSSGDSSDLSIGYARKFGSPLVEDLTVRLASCFIRCVLNWAQPMDNKPGPLIHFRDQRQMYTITVSEKARITAIDDGGVQIYTGAEILQVAILEGKRTFQNLDDGKPTVSDQVLAQMVGEALALKRDVAIPKISTERFVTVLAVMHYIKFFQFSISDDFIEEYEAAPAATKAPPISYLRADSTIWFDINLPSHRKDIVFHVLALKAWADSELGVNDPGLESD